MSSRTRASTSVGTQVTWSKEALQRYLYFGTSPAATWPGNFRDLNASITRLVTLADGGRISAALVNAEIARLTSAWSETRPTGDIDTSHLDDFDAVQLTEVVRVCRASRSLSEAGRKLFAKSRAKKRSSNDADRLRKYLARFDLDFDALAQAE